MISDEVTNLLGFTCNESKPDLTIENVRLAETVFNIIYRSSIAQISSCYDLLQNGDYSLGKIRELVGLINKQNSTRLSAIEMDAIANHIYDKSESLEGLRELLLNPDYPLVSSIRGLRETNEHVRNNYSFATKFCHYSCYYLFEDDELRDLYPIYDRVIKDYIKEKHGQLNRNLNDYASYVGCIRTIVDGTGISMNGFDHLIWIYYR